MRILHAVRQYVPGVGGIESYVSQLAARQAQAGHDVRVVTLNRIIDGDGKRLPAREMMNGVTVLRVGYRGWRRYPLAPGAYRHFRDADIIHVHGLEFFADFAALTRVLHRRPLVLSTHGGIFHTRFAWYLKQLWFHTITRLTLRGYRSVLASSQQDREIFARVAASKVELVENAVDTQRFAGLGRPDRTCMIYFGRLAPNKGLDRLIAWFARVHSQAPAWSLVVAGKEMGTSIEDLRRLAERHGVAKAVRFVRHPDDAALRGLIDEASVYACASRFEGFGIAAVEAIGAGLFPVLSEIAPFRRTIDRCGHGLSMRFEDEDAADRFLAAFAAFAADPEPLAGLPERLSPFRWDRVVEETQRLYSAAVRGMAVTALSMVGGAIDAGPRQITNIGVCEMVQGDMPCVSKQLS